MPAVPIPVPGAVNQLRGGDSRVSLPPFLNRYRVVVEVEISSQPGEEIVAVKRANEVVFEVRLVPGDDAVGLYAQCNFEEEPVFGVFPRRGA